MQRRHFATGLALTCLAAPFAQNSWANSPAPWADIERRVAGRLGVAVLDTATGRVEGHRLDERFPMCSTFKWMAAALVLRRVDLGEEDLQRRIRFGRDVLVSHSPVAETRVG